MSKISRICVTVCRFKDPELLQEADILEGDWDADLLLMRKNLALRSGVHHNNHGSGDAQYSESFSCENWSSNQVNEWLKGIDDSVIPYVKNFEKAGVDGRRLLNFGDDSLRRIGVTREAVRSKILHAIGLLNYYNHTVRFENLQKLAMDVNVSVGNLLNTVTQATPIINNPLQTSRVFDVLHSVLRAITDVYETVRNLMSWMDRAPFDDKKSFIPLREKISSLIKEIIDCVNNPNNPKFFSVPQVLVERGKQIQENCMKIVLMNEPIILYTAYMERATIRKTPSSLRWGFDIGCTYTGVNVVTRVSLETPAGISGKIDVGDEVLEVNGTPVVGWSRVNLLARMGGVGGSGDSPPRATAAAEHYELVLLLSKRPREAWSGGLSSPTTALTPTKLLSATASRTVYHQNAATTTASEDRSKMMLDFKLKIQPDLFARECVVGQPLSTRGRSLSFTLSSNSTSSSSSLWKEPYERSPTPAGRCVSLFVGSDKRHIFRRASVWGESPPAMLRSPFDRLHYQMESNAWLLLLASWGSGKQKAPGSATIYNGRMPLTPRLKEMNGVIEEEDFNEPPTSADDAKKTIISKEVTFSHVDLVSDAELSSMKMIHHPSIQDSDWNAPIRDITGLKIVKRIHLESGSATSIIDSPLSTIQAKITRFFYGDPAPSPSPSVVTHPLIPNVNNMSTTGTWTAAAASSASINADTTMSTSVSSEKLSLSAVSSDAPLTASTCRTPISKFAPDFLSSLSTGGKSGGGGGQSQQNFKQHHHSSDTLLNSSFNNLSASITTIATTEDSGGDSSSVDSPSPAQVNVIKTVASRRSHLAPLAEPDEVGDLTVIEYPRQQEIENVPPVKCSLRELASVPCQEHRNKTLEGWVRRQKLLILDSGRARQRESQWIKCWMVLKDNILYLYPSHHAHEADVTINVSYFYLSTSIDIKTSKKHVFALCWNLEMVNFALYSGDDLKTWLRYLQPLVLKSSTSVGNVITTAIATPDQPSTPAMAGNSPTTSTASGVEKFTAIFVRSNSFTDDATSLGGSGVDDGGSGGGGCSSPSSYAYATAPLTPTFTTPLPSPRASNFIFHPHRILSKVQQRRHSSLRGLRLNSLTPNSSKAASPSIVEGEIYYGGTSTPAATTPTSLNDDTRSVSSAAALATNIVTGATSSSPGGSRASPSQLPAVSAERPLRKTTTMESMAVVASTSVRSATAPAERVVVSIDSVEQDARSEVLIDKTEFIT